MEFSYVRGHIEGLLTRGTSQNLALNMGEATYW